MFLNIPVEIHYTISSYLSTFNIKHLSQTSIELRGIYHPILYRNCKVSDQYDCEIVPKKYWMIRSSVLFYPSNYSWFPNQVVQNIIVNDKSNITELRHYIKRSDYPNLASFKVVPERYRSQLVITLQNPILFAKLDFTFPHLSTNDFLPVVKSDEPVYSIKCPTNPGSYYVMKCSNTETRSMITSLNLNFLEAVILHLLERVPDIGKELNAYANLKDLKIWCSDKFNYKTFKRLINSVTKLKSLDSLMIYYQVTKKDAQHVNLLDNLQGSWKTFNLCIVFTWHLSTPDSFLRLPTVTNLMVIFDENYHYSYRYFEGKFEFGSDIRQLTLPFHSAGEFLSEYHRFQNVLDNLTTLKVIFPSNSSEFYKEDIEMVVFTKVLPNLKSFEIQMQNFEITEQHELDGFPKLSDIFFSLIPFGEFDILNYKSIKPYIMELKTSALEKWEKYDDKVELINRCFKLLKNANKDSNIYDLYRSFFSLQFLHSAFSCGYYNEEGQEGYLRHRAIISVLLLRLLQYTPNLETLTLLGVPLHEEFAAFHRLIKYHKHLKRVSTRMIFIGNMNLSSHKKHDIYSRYGRFIKPVRHQIHDNQIFVTKPTSNDFIYDLEGIEYDIEGFKKGYAFDFSSGPDKKLERYYFGEEGECIFADSLPLNINEINNYINRQDLLKRCENDNHFLCGETYYY